MPISVDVPLDRGIITPQHVTALLLMAVGGTMLTIPLLTARWPRWEPSLCPQHGSEADAAPGRGCDSGEIVARPTILEVATMGLNMPGAVEINATQGGGFRSTSSFIGTTWLGGWPLRRKGAGVAA